MKGLVFQLTSVTGQSSSVQPNSESAITDSGSPPHIDIPPTSEAPHSDHESAMSWLNNANSETIGNDTKDSNNANYETSLSNNQPTLYPLYTTFPIYRSDQKSRDGEIMIPIN